MDIEQLKQRLDQLSKQYNGMANSYSAEYIELIGLLRDWVTVPGGDRESSSHNAHLKGGKVAKTDTMSTFGNQM